MRRAQWTWFHSGSARGVPQFWRCGPRPVESELRLRNLHRPAGRTARPKPVASRPMLLAAFLALAPAPQDAPPQPFRVADGLEITLWAKTPQLYNPSAMEIDSRGRVWVTEAVQYRRWDGRNPGYHHSAGEGDRVVILEDTDGDGKCDSSKVFVQEKDLVSPLGICVLEGPGRGKRVLVSCSPNAILYTDADGDDIPEKRELFLTGFGGFDHDHGLHSFIPAPDGNLYFAAGNAGPHLVTDKAGWNLRSGSVYNGGGPTVADNKPGLVSDDGRVWVGGLALRVGEDGRGLTVLAHNFRNNYELALDSFGNVFQNDNDDDGNQGCRTTWVMEGGNYGYFSADGSRYWNEDRRPGQDAWAAHWHQDDPGVVPAGCRNGAGGPTGLCFYEGELMPQIRGAVLDCDAGRGTVWIHRPKAKGAGIELEHGVLLELAPGARDQNARWDEQFAQRHMSWFRPSDVCVAPDGSLVVADWYDPGVGGHAAGDKDCAGYLYRIAPKGHRAAVPVVDLESPEGACAALRSPALSVRYRAQRALADMGARALPALEKMSKDSDERYAARALWMLARLGDRGVEIVQKVWLKGSPDLRVTAMRALRSVGRITHLTLASSNSNDLASLRREKAVMGRSLPKELREEMARSLLSQFDPKDRYEVAALNEALSGFDPQIFESTLLDALVVTGDRRDVAWSLMRTPPALAAARNQLCPPPFLASSGAPPTIVMSDARLALDTIAFTPTREAAEAMMAVALAGPEDLRPMARWWLRHRAKNDWRDFGVLGVGEANRSKATKRWSSGIVKRGTTPVDVDITGAKSLFLVTTDAGDGNSCDWTDWLEPKLVGPKGELRLTELPWIEAASEWGETRVGRSAGGGKLRVDGKTPAWGIGAHAKSEITYVLPEGYTRFQATAAPDDGGTKQANGSPTSVEFEVWVELPPDRAPLEKLQKSVSDAQAPAEERLDAAEKLALDPEGGKYLLLLASKGKLDPALRSAVSEAIGRNPDLGVRALASAQFPSKSAGGAVLPPVAELAAMAGDPAHGRAVFLSKEAQCVQCHRYAGRGGDIGPDLSAIRLKYDKAALLDAILHPSAGITVGYETWLIATKDGRTLTGFLLADGPQVVLKDTQGIRHAIEAAQIEEKIPQKLSAMPEGLALGMTQQQLLDLVAFLQEDPAAPPAFGPTRDLFNGKDFSGWTFHLTDRNKKLEDVWSVVDGTIVCSGNPAGYIRTLEEFTNFRLELEWRFDPKRPGNSGVLMRMHGDDKVWPRSIEAQLMDRNAGDIWNIDEFPMLTDPGRTSGRHTTKLAPCSEKPHGEWNRYVITMNHGDLRLEVNGVLQNAATWCEEIPGKICLQSEGGAIQFRNIRLTPIVK